MASLYVNILILIILFSYSYERTTLDESTVNWSRHKSIHSAPEHRFEAGNNKKRQGAIFMIKSFLICSRILTIKTYR